MKLKKPIAKLGRKERNIGRTTAGTASNKTKKYSRIYVSMLKANSIEAKKILSQTLSEPKTSTQIVSTVSKKLAVPFRCDGRIGRYLIYKADAKKQPYYYVLNIS